MESLKIIPKKYHRKTKSFIFKYCNLSFFRTKENLFKSNKIDYENISLKSKNTQSASTGPDDRKENILKKSSSEKIINLSSILNRLSKRKNVHSIELILKGRRKGSTPEKNANEVININKKDDRHRCKEIKVTKINKNDSNQKIINSGKNKNINPKINNNNIIGKTYKEDKSNFNGITQLSRNILKAIPPKLNDGNGVYLISADNMTQLQHFTVENSNLLSNTVLDIDINNETGEVFFGAANGLCSYMSDATTTYDEMTKDNVWAYPNPVTPDYQGLITVVGLTLNADVKILASNGALVAEGRSSGGTFTWNGCDKNGDPVASGVYMVATAKADGSKGTVCKIAIVR